MLGPEEKMMRSPLVLSHSDSNPALVPIHPGPIMKQKTLLKAWFIYLIN